MADNIPLLGQNKNIWHKNIFDSLGPDPGADIPSTVPGGFTGGSMLGVPTPPQGADFIQQLLQGRSPLSDVGTVLGSFSQGKKADRIVQGNYTQDYDRMMMDREAGLNDQMLAAQRGRNDNETDALKKLQQASYISGGGNAFKPPSIQLGGQSRQLADYGFGPKASTDAEKQGAGTLQEMVLQRLKSGGSFMPTQNYQPHPLDSYAKPGMAENISSYGGAAGGILGGLGAMTGGNTGINGGLLSKIPGIGKWFGGGEAGTAGGGLIGNIMDKAAPIAGAVTGGMGLMKDRGLGGNMMNGASTGASIGTMFAPGLGTAIGAGVGALGGALRGVGGGPSDAEKAGRGVAAQGRSQLAAGATPEQQAEAQKSGWNNPQDALALIVVRDQLAKSGKPPEMANQLMQQLHQAEKQGPEAVQSIIQTIMGNTGGAPGAPGAAGMQRPQGW